MQRWGQTSAGANDEGGDRYGSAVAAGDLDGDGRDDLAIGVSGEDVSGASNAGMVIVYYGSGSGLTSTTDRLGQRRTGGADEDGDGLGTALAIGDFDGDGDADLAAGAPGEDVVDAGGAGSVFLFVGTPDGISF